MDEINKWHEKRIKSRRWYDLYSQYLQGRDITPAGHTEWVDLGAQLSTDQYQP